MTWAALHLLPLGDWMLPAGLGLYAAGVSLQACRNWSKRGLTDLTYTALGLAAAGDALLVIWAVAMRHWVTAAVIAVPMVLACWLVGWKATDFLRSRYRIFRPR